MLSGFTLSCPLCQSSQCAAYHQDKVRQYFQCVHCQLVFADPLSRISAEEEKAIYDLHQNDPQDIGYRQFLRRLSDPLQARLAPGAHGLDFGCGPGPTLSLMLAELGFEMANYDPFYANEPARLQQHYDFVCATEVIEHCCHPAREWPLLLSLLKPGGYLALMTKLVIDPQAFSRWHYKNDRTHVSFFSQATFEFLASRDGLTVEFIGKDVIMMQKQL